MGSWKHAQRSYLRGYLSRPPVAIGVELPLPPPPPVFLGVELPGPRVRSRWVDLCEEEDELMDTLVFVRPTGLETYLVDAPLTVKDISWPKTICLSVLLDSEAEKTPGLSNIDIIIGIILEQPSQTANQFLRCFLPRCRTSYKYYMTWN